MTYQKVRDKEEDLAAANTVQVMVAKRRGKCDEEQEGDYETHENRE